MKLREQRVLGASFWLVGCSLARLMLTVVARAVVLATFGAEGGDTDAFVAAFRLPQILGDHLLGGTLFLCVLPLLVEVRSRRGEAAAWALFRGVLLWAALALGALSLCYGLAARPILSLLVPELARTQGALLLELAYWLAPALGLLGLSLLGTAGLQSRRHFAVSALATLAVPVAVIVSVTLLGERAGVTSWAWGLVAGLLVQVGVQFWALVQFGFRWGLRPLRWGLRPLRFGGRDAARCALASGRGEPRPYDGATWLVALPVAVAIVVGQVSILVQQYFASQLPGALTYLYYAEGLVKLPLGLTLVPLVAALFPLLAHDWSEGRPAAVRENVLQGLRALLLLSVGVLVMVVVSAPGLIHFIFVRKAFTAENARLLSGVFLVYALALLPLGAGQLVSRSLYASGAVRMVLMASGVKLVAAVLLYAGLYRWGRLWGLAGGYVVVQWVMLLALVGGFARRHGPVGWGALMPAVRDTLLAGAAALLVGGVVRWLLLRPWSQEVWTDLVALALAGGVFVLVAWLLGNAELRLLVARLRERATR